MARNLVQEKQEDKKIIESGYNTQVEPQPNKEEVKVITFEELIANNLSIANLKLDQIKDLLVKGFKEVGVDWEKVK